MGRLTQNGCVAAIKVILEAPEGIEGSHLLDAPKIQQHRTDLTAPGRCPQQGLIKSGVESPQRPWRQSFSEMAMLCDVVRVLDGEGDPVRVSGSLNEQSLIRLDRNQDHALLTLDPDSPVQRSGRDLKPLVIATQKSPDLRALLCAGELPIQAEMQIFSSADGLHRGFNALEQYLFFVALVLKMTIGSLARQ